MAPLDYSNIGLPTTAERPIDPIELFQSLKVTDPAINDLWLVQGDALREWHEHRALDDIAIVINTGAGKTLVGLIAAQSLVNETGGNVAYVCSSIQLVEQTATKAEGYGLPVTTYFKRSFSNGLYREGLAPCITTYQALFNGKTRFEREELRAVVFDDAHAADHILRDQYTLVIDRHRLGPLFNQITGLFRTYHARTSTEVGYVQTLRTMDAHTWWFVPPFAVREQLGELQRMLLEADLSAHRETMFAWAHLCDKIALCTFFVSGTRVCITPPVLPAANFSYFAKGVRRLYLSATLSAEDAFLRTFGRIPNRLVAPSTTAGECERLVLVPHLQDGCNDDIAVAKGLIAGKKALVLVPSEARGAKWNDCVTHGLGDDVTNAVEEFKTAPAPATLRLVARYDGVDLPGDTCRIMVIDDLPSGLGPLERFLWEKLGVTKLLRSAVASRTVQSFGRISRGMSDHGVVILTGKRLIDWLLVPANRDALPRFLRRQIDLGRQLTKQLPDSSVLGDPQRTAFGVRRGGSTTTVRP